MNRVSNTLLMGFAAFACLLVTVYAKSEPDKDRLARDLLKDYNSAIDPGKITVDIGLSLTCVKYDKQTESVTTHVWEYYSWSDPRLTWNATAYSGIDNFRIPAKFVWTPDTRVYNSLDTFSERDDKINVVLKSDGSVLWVPPATHRFYCKGTEDKVTCKTRIGSWTYDSNDVALKERDPQALDLDSYDEACPWVVTSHTAEVVNHKYPCCEERYPSLDITFELKRRSD